jgi:pantothenate kinase
MDNSLAPEDLTSYLHAKAGPLLPGQQFWLGIAGPPGAGKSTLCRKLLSELGDMAIVLPMDGYHYSRDYLDRLPDSIDAHRRRGAPFTFDAARFVREISEARKTGSGEFPSFDHGRGDPIANDIRLLKSQHRLVLVEGNYLLLNDEPWRRLKSVFDESWYLDTDITTCRARVLQRFLAGGLDAEAAQIRVETNDGPNAQLIAEQSPQNASRIIRIT